MSEHLPNRVDPVRLAELGRTYRGRIELAGFSRLATALLEPTGDASYELGFYRDEEGRSCVRGHVEALLILQCQRCLDPLEHPVRAEITLAVVHGIAEMERLPQRYDPILLDETDTLSLHDLVEDELLLALPQIARHETSGCAPRREPPTGEVRPSEASPFAVLARLKTGGNTETN